MIKKRQLLQAIVGLIEVRDHELLDQEQVLREIANRSDFSRVREIASGAKLLYDNFDYVDSPEFSQLVDGKSGRFVDMKKRLLSDPKRKAEQKRRFAAALSELPDSTLLLALVPQERLREVEELVRIVRELDNPD